MIEVSELMHEKYGHCEKNGIHFFLSYIDDLSCLDYFELLNFQMENFSHQYVLDFILATPFLWCDIPISKWLDFVVRKRNVHEGKYREEVGNFCDIEFLSRFVGVDALDFIMKYEEIDFGSKSSIINYFSIFPHALYRSEIDLGDLDGCYFVDGKILSNMKSKLIDEFNFCENMNFF